MKLLSLFTLVLCLAVSALGTEHFGAGRSMFVAKDPDGKLDLLQSFTIEGWVKATNDKMLGRIVDKGIPGILGGYVVDAYPANCIRFIAPFSDCTSYPNVFKNGEWSHFAVAFDDNAKKIRIYFNGKERRNGGVTNNPVKKSSNLFRLGASYNKGVARDFFTGEMGRIAIYDRALSAEEIGDLFATQDGAKHFDNAIAVWNLQAEGDEVKNQVSDDLTLVQSCKSIAAADKSIAAADNILSKRTAIFETKPNYPYCTDANDPYDLTDGKTTTSEPRMWVSPSCVGWSRKGQLSFFFDFESPEKIGKIRLRTCSGSAGVYWPSKIYVLGSNDNENYAMLDEMIDNNKEKLTPYGELKSMWLESRDINTQCRYLKFLVITFEYAYFFCDEIECTAGLETVTPKKIEELQTFKGSTKDLVTFLKYSVRLEDDLKHIQENVDAAKQEVSTEALKKKFYAEKSTYLTGNATNDFPLNQAQVELLRFNQELLQKAGFKGIVFWGENALTVMNGFNWPKNIEPAMGIKLFAGERRTLALNLTNALPTTQKVEFTVAGDLRIELSQAVVTTTSDNFQNANRLEKLEPDHEQLYSLVILPGETKQLYLQITAPRTLKPGDYSTILDFKSNHYQQKINIEVGHLQFPQKLSSLFGMFDYLGVNKKSAYGPINPKNFDRALELIEKNQLNCSWGSSKLLPTTFPGDFDASNHLTKKLDISELEAWIKLFPNADNYAIFFGGAPLKHINTGVDPLKEPAIFNARINSYLVQFAQKIKSLGLSPHKFILHFVDEPAKDKDFAVFNAWVTSAKRPKDIAIDDWFTIFSNVRTHVGDSNAFMDVDILNPNIDFDLNELDHYLKLSRMRNLPGQKFGLYVAEGNSRTKDPYIYYGLMFRLGFLFDNFFGGGFWDFASAPNVVNEFDYDGIIYSTLFFSGDKIYSSKQFEYIFESREDFEYLLLLKTIIRTLPDSEQNLREKGEKIAQQITLELRNELQGLNSRYWYNPKDRTVAEKQRNVLWNYFEEVASKAPQTFAHANNNWKMER